MSRYQASKSGLFLLELMINFLLFCFLCICGLTFFLKSNQLTGDATLLQHGVHLTSSVANIYETGDGSFSSVLEEFESAVSNNQELYIYFDSKYQPCTKDASCYYVYVQKQDSFPASINIDFCSADGTHIYSIQACNYPPLTPQVRQEEPLP